MSDDNINWEDAYKGFILGLLVMAIVCQLHC
jgi:hypothetical protein